MTTKLLSYYMIGSVIFGGMRKATQLYNAKIYDYKKDDVYPMLFGTKVAIFSTSLLLAPYITPIWIVQDLNKLDAYIRNIDTSESSETHLEIDYIFK